MNAYTLYKRIIKSINNKQIESVIFTKLENNHAGQLWMLFPERRARIKIDARKGDFLESFVHEMIHFLYPHFGEKRVINWSRWWMGSSSWKSKAKLLRYLLKMSKY